MSKKQITIKLKNIKTDPLGDTLSNSPEVRPYIDALTAAMTGSGQDAALARIRALPLERRYLWRIQTNLDLALADLDTETARLDIKTMPADQLLKIVDDVRFRLSQLSTLVAFLEKNIADTPPKGRA